jgi:hypothetical protein
MKMLLILFICLISLCVLSFSIQVPSGKYQNDLVAGNLKGKVKSCTKFFYDTYKSGDNIDSDYNYQLKSIFDVHGKTFSSMMSGNPAKKPISQTLSFFPTYDEEGRNTINKDQTGQIVGFSIYTRNEKNNLVEAFSTRPNSPVMLKIIYNNKGDRDTMYQNDASGKFMGKVIYHNNKNHDLIEEDEFYTNKEWSYKTIFNYDKNHNKIDEIRYDTKNANGTRTSYGYDDYGNMIMERDTSTEIYIGGNRIFSVDPTNKNYLIFKCKYSNFDSHKNWLRQDMFYKDSIAKTVKRVIEYYP